MQLGRRGLRARLASWHAMRSTSSADGRHATTRAPYLSASICVNGSPSVIIPGGLATSDACRVIIAGNHRTARESQKGNERVRVGTLCRRERGARELLAHICSQCAQAPCTSLSRVDVRRALFWREGRAGAAAPAARAFTRSSLLLSAMKERGEKGSARSLSARFAVARYILAGC